jgi:hypothetical protein
MRRPHAPLLLVLGCLSISAVGLIVYGNRDGADDYSGALQPPGESYDVVRGKSDSNYSDTKYKYPAECPDDTVVHYYNNKLLIAGWSAKLDYPLVEIGMMGQWDKFFEHRKEGPVAITQTQMLWESPLGHKLMHLIVRCYGTGPVGDTSLENNEYRKYQVVYSQIIERLSKEEIVKMSSVNQ